MPEFTEPFNSIIRMPRKIESQLITHNENGVITGPNYILRSAQSLAETFEPHLIFQAIYQLKIAPDPIPVSDEEEQLIRPLFLVMILEDKSKLLYCDMHICTIPILLFKENKLFAFPRFKVEDFCTDKQLLEILQNL